MSNAHTSTFYQWGSEEHERQGIALLAELGKFVVAFERVCAGIRDCIECSMWRQSGLRNPDHYSRYEKLVHGKPAGELRCILERQYKLLSDQDEDDKTCVKNLLSRIEELTAARNGLIHAYWFLNYDYEDAGDEFRALALSHVKENREPVSQTINVSIDTLSKNVFEATKLQVLLRRLTYCLNQKGFKVSRELSRSLSMNGECY